MEEILFFKDKSELINWLKVNHKIETELWIGFYRLKSGDKSITWSDSVDCAISFGWIDGIRKSIDEDSYKIRFTPRKANSVWSKVNIEKANKLIELKEMRPEGREIFDKRKDEVGYSSETRNIYFPKMYEEEIQRDPLAWEFFNQLPAAYKRDSIWWIMSAKKEETQMRRLMKLIQAWREGIKLRP